MFRGVAYDVMSILFLRGKLKSSQNLMSIYALHKKNRL